MRYLTVKLDKYEWNGQKKEEVKLIQKNPSYGKYSRKRHQVRKAQKLDI